MEILTLSLSNFRNFSAKKIVFDKALTVVIGANGSGKSNILEAASLLCGVRPQRVQTDLDLVKFSKSDAKVEGKFGDGQEDRVLTVNFQITDLEVLRKSYFIDGLKKRFSDFADIASMVVFAPADLDLVSGSPSLRRHHIDLILSSSDREYWRNLSYYNKVISRRNKVLLRIQEGKSLPAGRQAKRSELDFWDERLLAHAKYLSAQREDFFKFLNFVEGTMPISSLGDLSWHLVQSTLNAEKLLKNRERDIAAGVTLSGPHRDDFRFLNRDKNLAFFGSRGEQRMSVLALKVAELEYFRNKKKMQPILALDDIFSELDWDHREAVLSVISKQQTIITAAEKESVPKSLLKKSNTVQI